MALAQDDLDGARRQASAAAAEKDWLADRPDLKQIQGAYAEAERRRGLYYQARARLTQVWINGRIRELSPKWSTGDAQIDKVIQAYHDLRKDVTDGHLISTILRLDRELNSESFSLLADILKAASDFGNVLQSLEHGSQIEKFVRECVDVFVIAETREHQVAHRAAVEEVAEARRAVIAQFRHRLQLRLPDARLGDFVPEGDQALHQELVEIKASDERKRQEEESRRRRNEVAREEWLWWEHVETQSIESIIDRLGSVPPQRASAVLRRLLAMSATDLRIHNGNVREFFGKECHPLLGSSEIVGPLLVAYLAHLIADGHVVAAKDILDRTPDTADSALKDVIAFLRFIVADPGDFSGETHFFTLSPEDVFLGACYYGPNDDSDPSDLQVRVVSKLNQQSRWGYDSLTAALSELGDQCLHDFKVRGLQPRIAELAFGQIHSQIRGKGTAEQMCDRNRDHVKSLKQPWRLAQSRDLPDVDWIDEVGKEYDVKCNLFYPSKAPKIGLRGFLISKFKRDPAKAFPGVVFIKKTDDFCGWVYIGEYRPQETQGNHSGRVLPFYFRLPDSERWNLPSTDCDVGLAQRLLRYHRLCFGWMLAARQRRPARQRGEDDATALLYDWADRSVTIAASSFLEYALWKALTEMTLEACARYSSNTAQAFLRNAEQVISGGTLPIRLPRIGDTTLLSRWITEVLAPIAANWDRISSPNCSHCASQGTDFELRLATLTSGGSIFGRMSCRRCEQCLKSNVTILTQCYGKDCHRYPLVIGKNQTCEDCSGLVCECGRCKYEQCVGTERRHAGGTRS